MKFCKHIKPYFSLSALYFVEAVNINVHFFVWVRTFTAHYDLSFFPPRIRMMLLCRNKWQQRSCHIEFFMRRVGIHIFGFCFVMAAILLAMLRFTLIRPCTWFPWMPNEYFFGMLYKVILQSCRWMYASPEEKTKCVVSNPIFDFIRK